MITSKPSLRSGFDCIIRPAPSGAGRTTPSQPGHYPLNIHRDSEFITVLHVNGVCNHIRSIYCWGFFFKPKSLNRNWPVTTFSLPCCTFWYMSVWNEIRFYIDMWLQVLINGIGCFTFKHRLHNLKAIQHLIIDGDIRVDSVTVAWKGRCEIGHGVLWYAER